MNVRRSAAHPTECYERLAEKMSRPAPPPLTARRTETRREQQAGLESKIALGWRPQFPNFKAGWRNRSYRPIRFGSLTLAGATSDERAIAEALILQAHQTLARTEPVVRRNRDGKHDLVWLAFSQQRTCRSVFYEESAAHHCWRVSLTDTVVSRM
jgi:hypothetical protein